MKPIVRLIEIFGGAIFSYIAALGKYIVFVKEFFLCVFTPPFRIGLVFKQLEFVGNKSALIIFIAGLFVGAVLGLQLGVIFKMFSAEGLVGAATGKSLAIELGPVMCGFIVTGRAGAAMSAEIATMRVNEQIDAMEAMGVSPVSYLVVPRILASMLMMPILAGMFLFIGVIGCYFIAISRYSVDTMTFMQQLKWIVEWRDVVKGLEKSLVFGMIFSSISCYRGFMAAGGAKGVGEATTQSVVISLLTILISDFVITLFQVS